MINYIIRRLALMLPVLIGISLVSFFVMHLAPGSVVEVQLAMNIRATQEARQMLQKMYGLDQPIHIQYWNWLKRMFRLDFGNSFVDGQPVIKKIMQHLPITLLINFLSLILILVVSIPLGVLSAVKRQTLFDYLTTVIIFIGFATPAFWLALLLILLFGVKLAILPVSGIHSYYFEFMPLWQKILDLARHLILPVLVASFGSLAALSRYTKASMVEVLQQDFITAARAKGLPERVVVYKHALKNALLPVVTILGLSLPGLIGGSVIIESIFAIPGMGRLFYSSVMSRDYPTIMGILVLGAFLTVLGNLLADITYAWVDPRIRYK